MDEHKCLIEIGPYEISKYTGLDGGYWIQHESGEGMQVSEAKLSQWLHHFYEENF